MQQLCAASLAYHQNANAAMNQFDAMNWFAAANLNQWIASNIASNCGQSNEPKCIGQIGGPFCIKMINQSKWRHLVCSERAATAAAGPKASERFGAALRRLFAHLCALTTAAFSEQWWNAAVLQRAPFLRAQLGGLSISLGRDWAVTNVDSINHIYMGHQTNLELLVIIDHYYFNLELGVC